MSRVFGIILGFALLVASALPGFAQSVKPIVEMELEETEVIPGQPTVFRITVLVPTWLPKPVEFPSFEAPNLLVKLFERSTNPTSKEIDGETWSGVSRAYRLSPMVPGVIEIPPQELTIIWAEPGETEPNTTVVQTDPLRITGVLPEGAEGLDPFVAATKLELVQELSNEATELKPGESLTRTVTAKVTGTSPFALPPLLPAHEITGIAAYADEPKLEERTADKWLAGTRVETVSLVAESGGSGEVPAVEVQWWNLETSQVETATVDGFSLGVDGPVARNRPELDPRRVVLGLIAAVGVAVLAALVFRIVVPRVRAMRDRRRRRYEASEAWAYDQARKAVARRDYSAFVDFLALWDARLPFGSASLDPGLQAALIRLGGTLYGGKAGNADQAWRDLDKALAQVPRLSQSSPSFLTMPLNASGAPRGPSD